MEAPGPVRASLRDFLIVIFKRKFQILLIFLVTFSTVTVATLLARPTFEATGQILVKPGRENIYTPTTGSTIPEASINREEQINSEIEILKNPSLAQEVVETIGPAYIYPSLDKKKKGDSVSDISSSQEQATLLKNALLKFHKNLDIRGIKKSNIIEIRFKHTNPQMAAAVVDMLAQLYIDKHLAVYKTPHSYEFFLQQSVFLKDRLTEAENKLNDLKAQYNITALAEQQTILMQRTHDLRMSLNQTLSQEAEVQKRVQLLGQQLAASPKSSSKSKEISQHSYIINALEERLVELQLKEKELLAKNTPQSRLVQNVRDEIKIVQQKLAKEEDNRYGKTQSGANPANRRLHEELVHNKIELRALGAKRRSQKLQLALYQKELDEFNKIEVLHNLLQQEVDVDRQNYQLYLTKFEESRISDAMDSQKIASVHLIEPAQIPLKPVSPKVLLNLVLGLLMGAFGGLGLAFLLNFMDDSLNTVEDVENALGVPVLISITDHGPRLA